MPLSIKNASTTYQQLVNQIFSKRIGHTMEVYVEDMLVKIKKTNHHLCNLSLIFGILKKYKMRPNPTKCTFGKSFNKFLGFMIS